MCYYRNIMLSSMLKRMTVLNSHDSNSLTFATLTSYLDALQLLPIALFVSFKLPSRPTDMLIESMCIHSQKENQPRCLSTQHNTCTSGTSIFHL
jgi:hypothetical protein